LGIGCATRHIDIAKDCAHQTRAKGFTGMHGHGGDSAIGVLQKNMAAADTLHLETGAFQGFNNFLAADAGQPGHTVIC
jgi:hypothetical protein